MVDYNILLGTAEADFTYHSIWGISGHFRCAFPWNTLITNKLCGRPPQYAPPPASWPLTFWPWKWCPSHVHVTCATSVPILV